MEEKQEYKLLSIYSESHERLKELAKKNGRTMRGQLDYMLQQEEDKNENKNQYENMRR